MDIRKLRQLSLFDDFNQLGGGPVGMGGNMDYAPVDVGNANLGQTMGGIQSGMAAQPPPYIPAPTVDPRVTETERLKQLYDPETEAINMFSESIRNQPQLNDPGIARRIAASAAAFKGGPDVADRFMYSPYMRENARWKEGLDPQYKAASLERQSNQGQLTLAREIMRGEDVDRKQAEVERQNREKNRITEQENIRRNIINEKKNEIAAAKANGATFHTEGTKIIATFPDGKVVNTGVDTTNFSPLEIAALNAKGRLEEIGARTKGAIEIKMTAPAVDPNKNNDPLDTLRLRNNRFLAVADQYPQIAEKWFIPPASPGDNWRIKEAPEPSFWSDRKDEIEEYKKVRQLLGIDPPSPTEQQTAPPATPPGNQPIGGNNKPPAAPMKGATNPRDPNYGKAAPAVPLPQQPAEAQKNTNPRAPVRQKPPGIEPGQVAVKDKTTGQLFFTDPTSASRLMKEKPGLFTQEYP